jgi:PAS domain S-box-containing protein
MKLLRHKKAALLAVLTIIIGFSITAISVLTIYNNTQKRVYERLQNIVNHEKVGIEVLINKLGVNEYDIIKYLEHVTNKTNFIGENGEIVLAHMVNDSIRFLIPDKSFGKYLEISKSIPWDAPMQKALNRKRGYMKAIDCNGIEVFSAFTFVEKLNCGIVAKIPTSGINKPFVKVSIGIGITVLFFVYLFLRIWNPAMDNGVIKEKKLVLANRELAFQNNEKEKRAEELVLANRELAFQNNEKEKRAEELVLANRELAFQNNEKEKRAEELVLANRELAFQNNEKEKRAEELAIANTELAFQNNEKEKRAEELAIANTELAFQNNEKEKRAEELAIANTELAFQNNEKEKRAEELAIANSELAFQNNEKEKRAEELVLANTELAFQNNEKEKRAEELVLANNELAFQNNEKEKRAEELAIANSELAFQNNEKEKRAEELAIANTELAFQNNEKEKRAEELAIANTELAFQNNEKEKRAEELAIANTELAFQNNEKEKRAEELAIANSELAFQNNEKEKRAEELAIANSELAFQNNEKEKRAEELAIANTELAFQNNEKEKRAEELAIANTELAFQNNEKEKRAEELILANREKQERAGELVLANKEKEKRANELILANKELAYQTALDGYRSEMERIALDLTLLIDTANAPIFGIDSRGLVNEWNQTAEKITGFTKDEVLRKDLVQTYITEDYRESVKKVLDDALLGKETANYEFPLFTKDNRRVTVLLNSTTRRDADGKIVGVIGVGQDISEINAYNEELIFQNEEIEKREVELILANKELKKTNSELDRFVYSASHDLRSPLKSLLGLSNMIIDNIGPEDGIQLEQMVMMQSSIIKLDNFIEDILDYSRNARLEVAMIAIDFEQTIGEISNNLEHMDGANTIELKLEINQKMEFISDRARVNMIFNNIISNAIKYKDNSKENAFIAINVDCSNDFATISIEDNGIGIDEKNLVRIFDMFYRATKLSTGSGLGLYIAKEAIEKINGTMKIESELTQGTKFTITIPNQLVRLN